LNLFAEKIQSLKICFVHRAKTHFRPTIHFSSDFYLFCVSVLALPADQARRM
jgi:hypothetical protein